MTTDARPTSSGLTAVNAAPSDLADLGGLGGLGDPTQGATCVGTSRRNALVGLAAAAGALCAGCGSSSSGGHSGSATTSQPGAAGASTTSSAGQSSTASSSSSSSASGSSTASGAGGTALAQVSAIPVGGGKILSDQQIVLTQPTAGDIKAFSAICTHRGCTVGSVDNSLITCPCHGSQYKITDGSVVTGPATQALAPRQVKVENGQVMLAS
ncbi:MAG: Rieske (2Fe-2S) protein [Catenulisporales bacterium]|nr:Rieske (2Fe-2S) protein [Catenulisporales bacterium]